MANCSRKLGILPFNSHVMDRKRSTERGVTMLETTLLISVVFSITLAIVDIARVLMLEAILNKAAEDGLNVATKISNFDYDIRDLSLNDSRYYDFYEARRQVLEAATKLPLETFFTDPNTPSDVQLVSFEHHDTELNANGGGTPLAQVPVIIRPAAVLRPAEFTYQQNRDAANNVISTSIVPNDHKPPAAGNVLPPQPMTKILRDAPIEVELRAFVRPFCPQLLCPWMAREDGGKMIRGVAIGYRENSIPRGPLPAAPADQPPGYATATTVTTTTVALSAVTTTTQATFTGQYFNLWLWMQNPGLMPKTARCPNPLGVLTPPPSCPGMRL